MKSEKVVATSFIAGGGEMGERIRDFDWSKTSLGPIDSWPQSLRTAVNIVLQSPVPLVMLWGADGVMLYNDAYSIFAGARHPSLLGSKVLEGWPEVADFNRNVMDKGLTGETLSYKDQQLTLYRNNKAEEVWMDLNYSPVMDESGKPAGVLAVVVETTQRVLAEQRRQQAEERLQLAMSAAELVGTYDWHIQEDIFYSDARFAALFSVDPEKGEKGTSISDYLKGIHPEDLDRIQLAVQHAIETGEKYSQEYRLLQKDGSVRWIIARGECVYDENEKPWRFPGVVVDITELKLAEESLKNSEERFRALVNTMPQIAWTANPDGFLDWYNERWYEFTGFDVNTGGDQSWLPILHPGDAQHCLDTWYASVQSGELYQIEYRFWDRKTGQWRWHLGRALPLKDSQGRILKWFGTCTDIHEQKSLEAALKESEARFRIMADASPNFVWTLSPEGNITYLNKAGLDFHNLADFQEFNGEAWLSNLHPDDVALTVQAVETALANQTYYCVEHRAKGKNREYRWFLSTGNPSYLPNGELYGYVGSSVDITELKTAETELKLSEARFRAAVEAVNGVLWTNNAEGKMQGVQPAWEALTGQTYEEYQGYGWANAVHPEDAQPTIDAWNEAVKERRTFVFEHRLRCRDGTWRRFYIRAIPILDPDGSVREWVGVHTDITEEREREIEIQHANKLLSTISRIQSRFITEEDLWVLFADLVQDVLDLTDSKFGYIGEILYKETGEPYLVFRGLTNIAWSEETQKLYAQLQTVGLEFHSMDSLYGAGIRDGGSVVISNDPHHDPRGKGFPPGHPPVTAFMGLPIYGEGGKLIGQLAVANRPDGYSEAHAKFLEPLLVTCSNIIESCRNTQHRKKSEEALKESEERFRIMADASPFMIWLTDAEGQITYHNKTTLNFTGSTLDEVLNGAWLDAVHPDDLPRAPEGFLTVLSSRQYYEDEFRLRRKKDGQYRWLLSQGVPRFNEQCEFLGYIGSAIDITERKHAEENLTEALIRQEALLGNNPDQVWMKDKNLVYIADNEAHARDFGTTREAIIGKTDYDFIPKDLAEQCVQSDRKVLETGQSYICEESMIKADGTKIWYHVYKSPLKDEQGNTTGIVGVAHDITYRKLAEETLERTFAREQLLRKVVQIVNQSFDLNNLLNIAASLIGQFFNADRCYVIRYEQEGQYLNLSLAGEYACSEDIPMMSMDDFPPEVLKTLTRDLPIEESIKTQRFNTAEEYRNNLHERMRALPYMADLPPEKVQEFIDYYDQILFGKLCTSAVLRAGITYRGRPFGVIMLQQCHQARKWTDEEEELLQDLATQIGVAFYQTELFRQEQQANEEAKIRAKQQEVVTELGLKALSGIDLQELMDITVDEVAKTLDVKYCKILELLPDGKEVFLKAGVGWKEGLVGKATVGTDLQSQAGYTLISNEPVIVEDLRTETRFNGPPLLHNHGVISGMSLVIHTFGKPWGVMGTHATKLRRFSKQDINFFQAVANVIATAIERKQIEQEKDRAKEEAQEASRKKSEFLAMMSHELRTPLNSIIGYSRMIENGMGGPLTEDQTKYIKNVGSSGNHLLNIVNDLLDVSKVEAGKMVISPGTIEVKPIVDEVQAMMQELAKKSDVYVSFKTQPNIDTIEADPSRFKQILINLTSNAIKFNKKGGSVSVRLNKSDDNEWLIGEVQDTGIGIPKEKQAELFKKFYQVDTTASRKHEGTGLGLALTKDLIELHGGDITVDSEEHVGSTFTFRLPTRARVTAEAEKP